MTSLSRILLIFYFIVTTHGITRSRQALAPSLTLDRIASLRDSIEKLQQINERIRCRIKELRGSRRKRFVGPAQRLSDLIAPLYLTYNGVEIEC